MKELQRLQASFQAAILHDDHAFQQEIEQTARVSAAQRVGIYSEAYRLRLLEALEENCLGLAYLLGDHQFEQLGRRYIDHAPSTFRSIRWFGDQLAEYLRTSEFYREQPVLAEMADADWSLTLAFDAPDKPCINLEHMAAFAPDKWPDLVFRLHPSVRRLDLKWSVMPFRQQVESEADEVSAPTESPDPVPWLIWRQDLRVLYRSMEVDEAWALDVFARGGRFGEVCDGLTEWIDPEHAPARAAGFLKRWIVDELFSEVGVKSH